MCTCVVASVAVNKIPGIRAGLCQDTYFAHQGVELRRPDKVAAIKKRYSGQPQVLAEKSTRL